MTLQLLILNFINFVISYLSIQVSVLQLSLCSFCIGVCKEKTQLELLLIPTGLAYTSVNFSFYANDHVILSKLFFVFNDRRFPSAFSQKDTNNSVFFLIPDQKNVNCLGLFQERKSLNWHLQQSDNLNISALFLIRTRKKIQKTDYSERKISLSELQSRNNQS